MSWLGVRCAFVPHRLTSFEEKLLAKTKMLSSRPAKRRLARFGLPELLHRGLVFCQPPAIVRPRSTFSARVHRVVGVHRPRSRMSFSHHLEQAVAVRCARKNLDAVDASLSTSPKPRCWNMRECRFNQRARHKNSRVPRPALPSPAAAVRLKRAHALATGAAHSDILANTSAGVTIRHRGRPTARHRQSSSRTGFISRRCGGESLRPLGARAPPPPGIRVRT